jgi:hypothetical protein
VALRATESSSLVNEEEHERYIEFVLEAGDRFSKASAASPRGFSVSVSWAV